MQTDWENIDLGRAYERSLNIVDPLSFDTLLLEIHCNLPEINAVTIREQFAIDLQSRIDQAWEVFDCNAASIEENAKARRAL